jgi:hypothetical protein
MEDPAGNNSGLTWTRSDLFFLRDALAKGMPVERVAAFLGRTEGEVRQAAPESVSKPTSARLRRSHTSCVRRTRRPG